MSATVLAIDGPDEVALDVGGASSNTVTVNGKTFVAGLFWQPLSSPRHYMSEARAYGKEHDWDIVAIRKGRRIQAGFIRKDVGAIKGMYSLAASLAGVLGDTWLGAFEIGDGRYFVCAVKDGSIVPGFDVLVVTQEEAQAKLAEGLSVVAADEDHVYAPAEFQFCQKTVRFAEVLQPTRLRKDYQLKQLRFGLTRKEWMVLAGLGVLLGVAAVVMSQYQSYRQRVQREDRIRQDQARRAELEKLNAQSKKTQTAQALVHPWASMPSAVDFASVCQRVTDGVPLSVGGWLLEAATCDPKGVSIAYRRSKDGATVRNFVADAAGRFAGEPAFADNGELALVGLPLGVRFAGDDPLVDTSALLNEVVSYFQGVGIAATVDERKVETPAPPTPEPGQSPTPAPEPTWRKYGLEYEAPSSPAEHFAALAGKSGVRLTEIKLTLNANDASLKWSVKGEVYAIR
jgi:hypothetical protein